MCDCVLCVGVSLSVLACRRVWLCVVCGCVWLCVVVFDCMSLGAFVCVRWSVLGLVCVCVFCLMVCVVVCV